MEITFGTDGIRGQANTFLTPELALIIARVIAQIMLPNNVSNIRPGVLIGYDSRISGSMLANAMTAGLQSAGVDVYLAGVVTTPQLAFLTNTISVDVGIMITASHNPMPDNGIKIFNKAGKKISNMQEVQISQLLNTMIRNPQIFNSTNKIGAELGRSENLPEVTTGYIKQLQTWFPESLAGITLVVDCANGAGSYLAPTLYQSLGATVVAINANPDGTNINFNSGVTDLTTLQQEVLRQQADLGIAHDGDADRCLAITATGKILDGDSLLVILGLALWEQKKLAKNTLVATVMSNYGLIQSLTKYGIKVLCTPVGDKHVMAELMENDLNFGGEQSGHIIFRELTESGDGLITAVALMQRMKKSGLSLDELTKEISLYPQTMVNVPVENKALIMENSALQQEISQIEALLTGRGRILVRPSGTENLIRVMVETKTASQAQKIANRVAKFIRKIN